MGQGRDWDIIFFHVKEKSTTRVPSSASSIPADLDHKRASCTNLGQITNSNPSRREFCSLDPNGHFTSFNGHFFSFWHQKGYGSAHFHRWGDRHDFLFFFRFLFRSCTSLCQGEFDCPDVEFFFGKANCLKVGTCWHLKICNRKCGRAARKGPGPGAITFKKIRKEVPETDTSAGSPWSSLLEKRKEKKKRKKTVA